MTTDPKDDVKRIAESIAEGVVVDWKSTRAGDAGPSPLTEHLRLIEKVALAHRDLPALEAVDPAPGDARGEAAPAWRWGSLEILGPIGRGTFGEVFRAQDPGLHRDVALKLIHPEHLEDRSLDVFLAEARALASVRHPNLLVVHGAAVHDGRPGIWMDLVRGKTLEALLADHGPMGAREAAGIGLDLCRAVAAVHARGIVHRDVKTTNVMREEGGRVVLMDFGAASHVAREKEEGGCGTPLTMPPEQLLGGQADSPSVDMYALGVLLFRLVTRRYPVEATSVAELCRRHQRKEYVSLRSLRPDLQLEFVLAIERALEADPRDRYRDAAAFERALASCLGMAPSGETPWTRRRSNIALWALAGVALVVLIGSWILIYSKTGAPPGNAAGHTASSRAAASGSVGARGVTSALAQPVTAHATLFREQSGGREALSTGDRVKPGDKLSLDLESADTLNVYVIDQDANGVVFVLFPVPGVDPSNPLAPGKLHRIPGFLAGRPITWQVTSAGGEEEIFAVASRKPLEALEDEIARFPRAREGRPISYGHIDRSILLRGIGGISAPPTDRDRAWLSDALRRLAGSPGNCWLWVIALKNPG